MSSRQRQGLRRLAMLGLGVFVAACGKASWDVMAAAFAAERGAGLMDLVEASPNDDERQARLQQARDYFELAERLDGDNTDYLFSLGRVDQALAGLLAMHQQQPELLAAATESYRRAWASRPPNDTAASAYRQQIAARSMPGNGSLAGDGRAR